MINKRYARLLEQAQNTYTKRFNQAPQEQWDSLVEQVRKTGVLCPPLCQPVLYHTADKDRIAAVIQAVTGAIEKIGDLFYSGEKLPDGRDLSTYIPLSPRVQQLCQLDSHQTPRLSISRYDAGYNPRTGELSLLEINAGDPSGLAYNDVCLQALQQLPAYRELQRHFDVSGVPILPLHRKQLTAARSDCSASPTLAFAVARDSTVLDDHSAMLFAAKQADFETQLGDPRDFLFDGTSLLLKNRPIDIVYRDTIDEFALDPYWQDIGPFVAAYRAGCFQLRNLFCSVFADFKALFDILSDQTCYALFSPSERQVLRNHIPWTRLIRECKTEFDGETVDLIDFCCRHRNSFVIKPNEGYGGFGILIGYQTAQAEWEQRIQSAVKNPGQDILQQYVKLPELRYPTPEGGLTTLPTVASFWQFGERAEGYFARASNTTVINVHQGGGIGPSIWVQSR